MYKIVISGWIEEDGRGEVADINDTPIHDILNDEIDKLDIVFNDSLCYNEEDEHELTINKMIDNVSIQIHVSDKEITLEEANNNCILMSLG